MCIRDRLSTVQQCTYRREIIKFNLISDLTLIFNVLWIIPHINLIFLSFFSTSLSSPHEILHTKETYWNPVFSKNSSRLLIFLSALEQTRNNITLLFGWEILMSFSWLARRRYQENIDTDNHTWLLCCKIYIQNHFQNKIFRQKLLLSIFFFTLNYSILWSLTYTISG